MPVPTAFTSNEVGNPSGFDFAAQALKISGGATMYVAGGEEVLGQPNFQDGGSSETSPTDPWTLNAASSSSTFSVAKTHAAGCSKLLVKGEVSLSTSNPIFRIWWQDNSTTTPSWYPAGEFAMPNTEVASDKLGGGSVPGYLSTGFHLATAIIPVLGATFKVELVDPDGGAVSLWVEGI